MITKGYLLYVSSDERVKSVLAVSENLQELEDKIVELKKAHEEKKNRYVATLDVQKEYFEKYYVTVRDIESFYLTGDEYPGYKIKEFVTGNPIPPEIKEFVKYSQDRDSGSLYFYSDRDFQVKYWITNIIGFK